MGTPVPRIAAPAVSRDLTRPLLLIDVDGVVSLFGFDATVPPDLVPAYVDGFPHLVSRRAGHALARLAATFECVWCTGWEARAAEHLPPLLRLEQPWPYIVFAPARPARGAHWKLRAIDAYAGAERPLAWIDDGHTEACVRWARDRRGPTRLVTTETAVGLTESQADELEAWARGVRSA